MRRILLSLIVMFLLPATAHAATYYASPSGSGSTCTQAAPCSLSGTQAKMVAGDTGTLLSGNYGSFGFSKGGTSDTARIKWVAATRFGPVFSGINTVGAFVDIGPGLQVTNPGITCGSNISPIGSGGNDSPPYVGAHDVRIVGNWIHDIGTNASGWATSGCRDGGGIYVSSPSWTLQNNRIENVISDCITSWHSPSNMVATNNTIVNCGGGGLNLGGQTGGGYGANNIIVNANLGKMYQNSSNTWVNNLVFGTGPSSAGGVTASGTLTADPLFVSSTDRHLRAGSPAIDTGVLGSRTPATDIEGNARGTSPDRGAYEAGGTPPPPPPTDNPPSAVSNFRQTDATNNTMVMSWTAATDDVGVASYNDYNDGALVGTLPGTATSGTWGDGAGEHCGETHLIGIEAVDTAGHVGPRLTVSASTTSCGPPPPPPPPATCADGNITDCRAQITDLKAQLSALQLVADSRLDKLNRIRPHAEAIVGILNE